MTLGGLGLLGGIGLLEDLRRESERADRLRHYQRMANISHDPRCVDVPSDVRKYVTSLIRDEGAIEASRRLGVSRQTAMSAALGLPIMPGSLSLIRDAIARGATR